MGEGWSVTNVPDGVTGEVEGAGDLEAFGGVFASSMVQVPFSR